MSSLEEIRANRLKKLKLLEQSGINPYPSVSKRTHSIGAVLNNFFSLKKRKTEIIVAGRLMAQRGHGGLLFLNLQDGTGKIQIILRKDKIGEKGFSFFLQTIDIGDFIEIKGIALESKTKEKSIQANDFRILTKSLLPLHQRNGEQVIFDIRLKKSNSVIGEGNSPTTPNPNPCRYLFSNRNPVTTKPILLAKIQLVPFW